MAPDENGADAPVTWELSLDQAAPAVTGIPARVHAGDDRSRRRRVRIGAALAGLVLAAAVLSGLMSGEDEQAARPQVVGSRLAVPVSIPVPPDSVPTADGSYVGLKLQQTPANVLVTVPTQVSEPSGARAPLPPDPAAWLMGRQDLLVTRVRDVRVAGRRATQIDYRVSSTAAAANQRFATVSLFCGWRPAIDARLPGGGTPCTRISSQARVRATFVPIGDRTLLVEVVWPADTAPWAQAPVGVRRMLGGLLAGVSIQG